MRVRTDSKAYHIRYCINRLCIDDKPAECTPYRTDTHFTTALEGFAKQIWSANLAEATRIIVKNRITKSGQLEFTVSEQGMNLTMLFFRW